MPAGRPTKYTKDMPERLIEYLERYNELGEYPTLAGFAIEVDITRETLKEWAKDSEKYPEFSCAYKKVQEYQEAILVRKSLNGDYKGPFPIFVAKNNLGWHDKQEIDHSSKDGTMTPTRPADLTAALLDTTDHTG